MKKSMMSFADGFLSALQMLAIACIAAGVFSANAQSWTRDLANEASALLDAIREGREQAASPSHIKQIFALARSEARDGNIDFCGFFTGMSRYDANALVKHYGLKDGEYRLESNGEKAVWRISFTLSGVRRVTKGGNTFSELAQAVANRVGDMEGRMDFLSGERRYERKTIDGITVKMYESTGLSLQQESVRSKDPNETVTAAMERRDAERAARQKAEKEAMRRAAEQGDASSQAALGMLYYKGDGVVQDKAEAVRWYRKAAEQGYTPALALLGACYAEGDGVTQDKAEAARWYRKAAEQGDSGAQTALDKCYYDDGKNATIPEGARNIERGAFSGRSGLTSVTIPASVTRIGYEAFYNCSGLTSVTIPNGVTSIEAYAFSGCSGLTGITIPASVISIGDGAFYRCSGLTSVMIPNGVTSIGDGAFYNCSGLTSVTIPDTVTHIGSAAFHSCSKLTSFTVSDGNPAYTVVSNLLLTKSGTTLVSAINGNGTTVTIPASVVSIGDWAFYNCTALTNITIPASVTCIEDGAFSGCSGLTSVTIPNGVTCIEDGAFSGCSGLTSVTIPNGVTSIGNGAFYRCSGLTSVTIPDTVTHIGYGAFDGCALKVAYLPVKEAEDKPEKSFFERWGTKAEDKPEKSFFERWGTKKEAEDKPEKPFFEELRDQFMVSPSFPEHTEIKYYGGSSGIGVFLLLLVVIGFVVGVVLKRQGRLDGLMRSKVYVQARNICCRILARIRAEMARR